MAKKEPTFKTIDPAAAEMLVLAEAEGISTAFSRTDDMKPCPICQGRSESVPAGRSKTVPLNAAAWA
jgi:hypothetical protein|tara:strand:- start:91 stop:291 length:201 start_codon:yes stop_codon:yes gene_type:complete